MHSNLCLGQHLSFREGADYVAIAQARFWAAQMLRLRSLDDDPARYRHQALAAAVAQAWARSRPLLQLPGSQAGPSPATAAAALPMSSDPSSIYGSSKRGCRAVVKTGNGRWSKGKEDTRDYFSRRSEQVNRPDSSAEHGKLLQYR